MPNRLIRETSPYLLQHAHNPVDWFPYGDEAFAEAKRRNVPVLISIGYSACHWCHMMERESFEDAGIAGIMNENFVCVKVDREERPDVDHVYMNAVQLIQGQGGWPLNCFALPDGRPFWGGTYFGPGPWKEILIRIAEFFRIRLADAEARASEIVRGMAGSSLFAPEQQHPGFTKTDFETILTDLQSRFDSLNGGFGHAPKFPMPSVAGMLLHFHALTGNRDALQMALKTLHSMAAGGIYDQAGGGFARYSTDAAWKVPHFEKMLYDNALLVSLYCDAFKISGEELFRKVADETLAFVSRELTSPEGVFCSSLDADSQGEEGLFYTWTYPEFEEALGPYSSLMAEYFGVGKEGLWEHERNILLRPHNDALFAQRHFLSQDELSALVARVKRDLHKYRNRRPRPATDDKVLTAWNAMMIKAYADAGMAFGNREYIETACQAAAFILNNMKNPEGGLFRSWKNSRARIEGFLDDHAFMAGALLRLYQATSDEYWLGECSGLIAFILEHFQDPASGLFFFSGEKSRLFAGTIETNDGAIPSSNSILAGLLFTLGTFMDYSSWCDTADRMMARTIAGAKEYPLGYANWCTLAMERSQPACVLAACGEKAGEYMAEFGKYFLPGVFIAGSSKPSELPYFRERFNKNKTLIYICYGQACLAPVATVEEAIAILRERHSSENSFTSLR
ncbi:MAG TPA: thioredoxin domain-containing protein [Bacteroidales bacterium]|nr:thioredoxin domain-containing protein [Bacteroidales bacterium]